MRMRWMLLKTTIIKIEKSVFRGSDWRLSGVFEFRHADIRTRGHVSKPGQWVVLGLLLDTVFFIVKVNKGR